MYIYTMYVLDIDQELYIYILCIYIYICIYIHTHICYVLDIVEVLSPIPGAAVAEESLIQSSKASSALPQQLPNLCCYLI